MDPCAGQKMITHADGTLVSKARPALLGETLVLYLLGLGATDIYVPEGQAAPANPAKVAISMQASVGNTPVGAPFAGLVPGLAGLYQVNIPLPSNPVPTFTSIDGLAVSLKIEAPGFALSTFVPAGW
jgi:uncharacterized protein (TIGR03437 family)